MADKVVGFSDDGTGVQTGELMRRLWHGVLSLIRLFQLTAS
ncbi:MAG: hypothetical protein ACLUP7_02250 [Eubacterium sp.]